jgi:hypothetical protein
MDDSPLADLPPQGVPPAELPLSAAVSAFALVTRGLTETQLETPWTWHDYDEGLRMAFFRTYQELRELAVGVAIERAAQGPSITAAQRVLGQYRAAYRDLYGVLAGAEDTALDTPPGEGEWSLRAVVRHIIASDIGFWAVCRHALAGMRSGRTVATPPTEAQLDAFDLEVVGGDAAFEQAVREAPSVAALLDYYGDIHRRVLSELAGVTDAELAGPSRYWESEAFPLQFRLHRFDAHLRQHTIQAEKTLLALHGPPSEAQRLLRLIYDALGEAEGAAIGAPDVGVGLRAALAEVITARAANLRATLA